VIDAYSNSHLCTKFGTSVKSKFPSSNTHAGPVFHFFGSRQLNKGVGKPYVRLWSDLSDLWSILLTVFITHADLVDVPVTMTIVLDSVLRRCALWLVVLCLLDCLHVINLSSV